eukprot:m.39526 g.39526  ORF g.39526 m.39526 type:complete len:388 (+) comp9564_c0_seq1:31-1194(+)
MLVLKHVTKVIVVLLLVLREYEAYPTLWNTPQFSYETLGHMTFAHVTKVEAFNATDLEFLSRFSIVQFDKAQDTQDMPYSSQEDRFIAAARQIKKANPRVTTLMYLNGLINFPAFSLKNSTDKDPRLLLRNSEGSLVKLPHTLQLTVFDMRNDAMRQLFVDDAVYGVKSGAFDGVFIDRANWAQRGLMQGYNHDGWDNATFRSLIPAQAQLFADLTDALGQDHIVLAKETGGGAPFNDWQHANAAMVSDTFCSNYASGNRTPSELFDKDQCVQDIFELKNQSARGQLTECHGQGPIDDSVQREFTIACFLIGAGNMSFFEYAGWEKGEAWSLPGTRWWPEYDKPLGNPISEAERIGQYQFSRNFSLGTKVFVDLDSHSAKISWGSSI